MKMLKYLLCMHLVCVSVGITGALEGPGKKGVKVQAPVKETPINMADVPVHNETGATINVVGGSGLVNINAGDATQTVKIYQTTGFALGVKMGNAQYSFTIPSSLKPTDIDFIRFYKSGNAVLADFSAKSGANSVTGVASSSTSAVNNGPHE